jgi:hypothetical protein
VALAQKEIQRAMQEASAEMKRDHIKAIVNLPKISLEVGEIKTDLSGDDKRD